VSIDARTANSADASIRESAESIVDEYERYEVSQHPFFERLRRNPVDHTALWLLMANLQCSISGHFVRWLAYVIEHIDDPRIASLLAKQLNDELGNGDFTRIHSLLLEHFVDALGAWRPREHSSELMTAGGALLARMTEIFGRSEPYDAIGALMVSEIFAKKMDSCVGDELRRQTAVSGSALIWLNLHECLEVDHAEDSRELAVLVPPRAPQLTAAARGARDEWDALWSFLDQIDATAMTLRANDNSGARP
jgi:pyrroloquinoline quinone (PQQ) biosynthesis protein C